MRTRTLTTTVATAALVTGTAWTLGTYLSRAERASASRDADRWRYRATHDALTGLPNRFALTAELTRRAARGHLLAILTDVDRLKPVNDTFGHAVGDHVIVTVADRLAAVAAARHGFAARLGGDEFVLLLPPPATEPALDELLRDLHLRLGDPITVGEAVLSVWSSLGAVVVRRRVLSPEVILGCADAAMYRAKRAELGADVYLERIHGSLDEIAARVAGRPTIRLREHHRRAAGERRPEYELTLPAVA